ncbi:xylulokinase [Paratractidigestivibacter sp.]|uniref:xylulokinase n=1 Tax=Paratractidigestivibacter sp. TaxID=2847316 RepID=UPI002ABE189E|nr:FGGY-family carbohydrate kinase [Paratractidigestivibacter sp.]
MDKQQVIADIESGRTSLGIEYGSTRIKAVLDDSNNEPVAIGTFDWENSLVDGYWTYSEDEVFAGLKAAYASLKADVAEKYGVKLTQVGALGISAMMHGYLPFDAAGKLLVPFRTWRNTTTTEAAHELSGLFAFHTPERWSVSHIYQAVLNGEEHVPSIDFFTTLAGFVHWRLTGEKVLSIGDASGMFPIDSTTYDYDAAKIAQFDELVASKGVAWKVEDLLPKVLVAGEVAGHLTEEGTRLLDPEGDLQAGCPLCPPEGDAGTGMIATNSIAQRTGNVSAGTSVFSMIVLEHALKDATAEEIDLVTTPVGDPVAMVHCNNCTSDINDWVDLLADFAQTMGTSVDKGDIYTKLFNAALTGDKDAGGLVSIPFISGETVMGVQTGFPMVVRKQNANFNVANFMRMHIMAAFGALAAGNEALRAEDVKIDKLYGHGGIFKTPKVAQSLLAAALEAPVTVMSTAGEGGAWGQAVAASYMANKAEGENLADFLNNKVFAGMEGVTVEPDDADVEGYRAFLDAFKKVNEAEKTAEAQLV